MDFVLVEKLGNNYFRVVNPDNYKVADDEWIVPFRYVFGYWDKRYEGVSGDLIKRTGMHYEIYTGNAKVVATSNSHALF